MHGVPLITHIFQRKQQDYIKRRILHWRWKAIKYLYIVIQNPKKIFRLGRVDDVEKPIDGTPCSDLCSTIVFRSFSRPPWIYLNKLNVTKSCHYINPFWWSPVSSSPHGFHCFRHLQGPCFLSYFSWLSKKPCRTDHFCRLTSTSRCLSWEGLWCRFCEWFLLIFWTFLIT